MSTHRYEFTRKNTKKVGSKQKGYAMNTFRPFQRKSKDFTDVPNESQNSPRQPNNIIANLRSQLGNLKLQVAKLSKKDIKNRQSEGNIENINRNELQKKNDIRTFFTSEIKSRPSNQETKESFHQEYHQLRVSLKKITQENQHLKNQISNFVRKQNDLQQERNKLNLQMSELNDKYKKQYEAKIHQYEIHRQRKEKAKLTEEVDRTISVQNQILSNKQQINELETQIKTLSDENRVLRNKLLIFVDQSQQIEKLKFQIKNSQQIIKKIAKNENQLLQKIKNADQKVVSLSSELQGKKKIILNCNEDIKKYLLTIQDNKKRYVNLEIQKMQIIKNLTIKLNESQKKVVDLQKNVQRLSNQPVATNYVRIHSNSIAQLQKQLMEKKQIITIHQKSLSNQQNDICYLQAELSKCSHFKYLSRDQDAVIAFDNEQLISIGLAKLNQKYRL